jgi:hypothetical protein
MRSQKFEGASVGIFNSNIIARDLGLKENVDNTTNGKDLNTNLVLTKEAAKKISDALEDEC